MARNTDKSLPGNIDVFEETLSSGSITIQTGFAEIYDYSWEYQSGQTPGGGERLIAEFGVPGKLDDSMTGIGQGQREEQVLFDTFISGTLSTGDDNYLFVAGNKGQVTNVEVTLIDTGGTSGSTDIDIEKGASAGGGTSIFSTKPTIANGASNFTIDNGTLDGTEKYFEANDIFHVNIDAVPGTASSGLVVTVYGYFTGAEQLTTFFFESAGDITRIESNVATLGNDDKTSVQYAFADDGGSFTDESADAKEATDNDVNLFPSTSAVGDAFYYGIENSKFKKITHADGTDGVQGSDGPDAFAFEYWDGSSWVSISATDGTSGYTDISGEITWTIPSDWAQTTVNSQSAFWVRARVTSIGGTGAWDTQPQAKSIDLGLSTILDVNVAGTSIWNTNQENRPHHYDNDSNNYLSTTSFDDAAFAQGEALTIDVDYAAPSTGTEPDNLSVKVYGSFDSDIGPRESLKGTISDISGQEEQQLLLESNNPESTSQITVKIRGRR